MKFCVCRLKFIVQRVARQMLIETCLDNFLDYFRDERQIRDRSVITKVIFVEGEFFSDEA